MKPRTAAVVVLALLLAGLGGSVVGQFLEAVIPVGETPLGILWNPASNKVYVCNEQGYSVTIIDGVTNAVRRTLDLDDIPSCLALNPGLNKVYLTSADANRLYVIDGARDSIIRSISIAGGPGGMAHNSLQNKLYVACYDSKRLRVLDAGSDSVVGAVPLGREPLGLVWLPTTNRVLCVAQHDQDTFKVVDCWTDQVVARLPAGMQYGSMVWNPSNGLVYAGFGWPAQVFVLSATGDSVHTIIPGAGNAPWSAVCVPYPNKLYVGDVNGTIADIDCGTHTVLDTFVHHGNLYSLVCDTVRWKLYSAGGASVHVWDVRADTLITRLLIGRSLCYMAWNPTSSRMYVTDQMNDVVYVIRDTTTGIGERQALGARASVLPTLTIRCVLNLPGSRPAELVDAAGRRVFALRPGANDLRGLAPGAYVVLVRGRPTAKVVVVH